MIQKFFFILLTVLSISSAADKLHAGALAGATEPTQWLNNFELVGVNISGASTAINTNIDMVKNTIADPIANGIINAMLQTTANSILSWAKGGFSGDVPVIIDDPSKYLTKVGLDVTRSALASVPQDSIFGDSIFSAIRSAGMDSSLEDKLIALSDSDIPELVQENSCNDDTLTRMAEERLTGWGEEGVTAADIANEKAILYDNLCAGDPGDPEVAERLIELNNQDPSITGPLGLVALATNNAYRNSMDAVGEYEKEEAAKVELKKLDLFNGQNALSETGCELEEDAAGNTFCKEGSQKTITPSDTLNNAINLASTAGLQRLFNISGVGSLTSLLTEFATQALTKGLVEGISSLRGGGDNASETIGSSAPYTQDLENNPKDKDSFVVTMNKDFAMYKDTLNELAGIVANYNTVIASYESRIGNMMTCYNSLQNRGADYQTAKNLYDTRMATITQTRTILDSDTRGISQARTIINDTESRITNSNSSEEIGDIYMSYQNNINNPSLNLPTFETVAKRKADYQTKKSEAERDEEPEKLLKTCNELKAAEGSVTPGSGNTSGGAEGGI